MANQPLKRNENLVPLSREHHAALLLGWKIKKGLHNGTELSRIKKYVSWFWENHLQPHQQAEESILFLDAEDSFEKQAESEHRDIENRILALDDALDETALLQIAETLEAHIRFEERVLFPHLEQKLAPEKLKEVGEQLREEEGHDAKENYEDPFWEKNTK